MGGRGLSAEEKRVKMLEIFHETKDFYQLKELEKLGPKLKGIVAQTVKEVVQSLVDDGLVQMDKIGASNFFWSFSSQQGVVMSAKFTKALNTRARLRKQVVDIQQAMTMEREARPPSDDRDKNLSRLAESKATLAALDNEIQQYGACNPKTIEEKERGLVMAKEAALRWTDNFSITAAHFGNLLNIEGAELRKHFSIPDNYEEIC